MKKQVKYSANKIAIKLKDNLDLFIKVNMILYLLFWISLIIKFFKFVPLI